MLSEDRDQVAEAYERLLARFERHNDLPPLPPSRLLEVARRIATESLPRAKNCLAEQIEDRGLISINATVDGRWEIYDASKVACIDESIPLTSQNTASVEALAAALMEGFSRKDDLAASRKSDVRESSRTR